MSVLTGLLLGLGTLAFIGPVLFYLIKATFDDGKKAGIAVAIGIIIGDIIYAIISYYGAGEILLDKDFNKWVSFVGGLILLGIGVKYIIYPISKRKKITNSSLSIFGHGVKGFLINFVNPFVFVVWVGFVSLNQAKFDSINVKISLATTLGTIFLTDILKVFLAHKIRGWLKEKYLKKFFIFSGLLMIVFSIRLFYYFLFQ